ncbi:translocation/assembly module TamB domain-containing protein [Stutzerimonas balearica]|uniref:translocation/assembly module TamB domain-containing protein n=1 Tax=Stutzerimonas balearica TaxID=74829 RepID=UPI0035E4382D
MKRAAKWVAAVLLVLVFGLVAAAGYFLGSESGSRRLLGWVPGLTVEGFEGRLAGRWRAERLRWQGGDDRVQIETPRLDWSPSCLLRLTLCINKLVTGDIEASFAPSPQTEPSEPFSLPDLSLPLGLRVGLIEIGRVRLDGVEQLQQARLSADWRGDELVIEQLSVKRDDLSAELSGQLQPAGDWPLSLQGEAALKLVEGSPWTLELNAEGALQQQLRLTVLSHGYLQGRLSGTLQPLDDALPADMKLVVSDFSASDDLPANLRLERAELSAKGDLQAGYRVQGDGQLAGDGKPVQFRLAGLADRSAATLQELVLDAGDEQRLSLQGNAQWSEALRGEARIDWHEFPWQRLYPTESPPVTLHRFTGELQYDDGSYLGHFDSALSGPAGPFTLASPVSGDLEQIHLPQLELRAGQGEATGSLSVGFAQGIDWKTDLQLRALDPAYWVAELPGQLGGSLKSAGAWRDERLEASAALDLQGRLRQQPATLRARLSGAGERWMLEDLLLQLGDNRVEGGGGWGERLDGQLQLELRRLAQLWPGLSGQARGRLQLAGTAERPAGELRLDAEQIGYEDYRLRQLRLDGRLQNGERASLGLTASGVAAGDTALGEVTLEAGGTREQHNASLRVQGPLLDLDLALRGALEGEAWQGRLTSAVLEASGQRWRLRNPTGIRRTADGSVELAAHCWVSGEASLCGSDQRLMPEPRLRYRLRDFQMGSLAELFPDDFAWQGELNADLSLDLPASGPNGTLRIDAGSGVLRMREADTWHDFPYQALALNSRLLPQRIDSELRFDGGELGELTVEARIDPRGEAKPLDGQFRLDGLSLAAARPFLPMVERIEGRLQGSGRLHGSLREPEVSGRLSLRGGELSGSALPTSFEDLQLDLAIDGQRMRFDGSWRSGESGQGQLDGTFGWQGQPDLALNVRGQRLPIVVEPYAELEAAPDLRITLENSELMIRGQVKVPRGEITVRDLPPSTVTVSNDAVIVGEEAEQPATPVQVRMDVDVEVGQERLRFSGFGLTADLAGYLHIGDDLDTRGELQLNNGRYRAYGQRLTIRRARLLFTGPLSQPYLDIEAIRRVEAHDVVAGLRITGSAQQPRVDVFAEPAMSQEQALSYLILGRPLGSDSGDNNLLARAAIGLGLAGSSSLTSGLASRLGIEDFKLDTEGSGTQTSVVASGQLTDRLTLRYGVGVFEPSNTIGLRYRLTKRLFLEAASGLASSLDLFYRRDF